jgi:hypothetical protein
MGRPGSYCILHPGQRSPVDLVAAGITGKIDVRTW